MSTPGSPIIERRWVSTWSRNSGNLDIQQAGPPPLVWQATHKTGFKLRMVGPNGLEPSTSSVSRKRSNQTELRAYMGTVLTLILRAAGNSGNVWLSAPRKRNHEPENS